MTKTTLSHAEPRFGAPIEHGIVRALIEELDRAGFIPYGIHVDGEDERGTCRKVAPEKIVAEIFEWDAYVTLHFAPKDSPEDWDHGVFLVQGNGVDIISDYHAEPAAFASAVDKVSEAAIDGRFELKVPS